MGALLVIGLLIEIAIAAYVIVQTQAEKKALNRFITAVEKDLLSAVEELPEPHRTIARPFADQMAMEQDLDDAIADAVVDASRQPFKRPLAFRLPVAVLCAFAFLSPMSYGLLSAAKNIVSAWERAQTMDRSLVYLSGQTDLEAPFGALRDGFQASALLFFGLAFIWAFAWHQRRPEVREARFIRALLEGAAKVRPGNAAPTAGRLSELIAPDRGLSRPITATVACVLGITFGWFVLYETAEVRAANVREPVFDVWPARYLRPVGVYGISIPMFRGGAPIVEIPPSVGVSPQGVTIGGDTIVELENRQLPEGWEDDARDLTPVLTGKRVMLVGDREISIGVVLDVLRYLQSKYRIGACDLLIERNVKSGEAGGRVLQASLPLELDVSDEERPALTVAMEERGLRILPGAAVHAYTDGAWQATLQAAVRSKPELLKTQARGVVEVISHDAVAYEHLVEILAAADTTCRGHVDCGLPGLGLRFRLRRVE